MKALIINSSYRKNGNSSKLCKLLVSKLENKKIEVVQINLSNYKINQCCGCRLCFDKGESFCPNKDDVLSIYNRMKNVDLIIWCSPVYVEDINGLLKTFIDRLAFNCHRPSLFNQKCFVYINSGSGASNHTINTIERANQSWGSRLIGHSKLVLGSKISEEEIYEKYDKKIDKDIKKIMNRIKSVKNPSFIQVLTFYIQKWYYLNKVDKNCFDYHYWNEIGWLKPDTFYYTNKKASLVKIKVAEILSKLIIRFILT